MHGSWTTPEPDGGGAEPGASFVQPAGTDYDYWFARLASDIPSERLQAAGLAVTAEGDRRTLPALLDRLEHDPDAGFRPVNDSVGSELLTRQRRWPSAAVGSRCARWRMVAG